MVRTSRHYRRPPYHACHTGSLSSPSCRCHPDPDSDSAFVSKDFFLRREFSFTIGDDIYIRYQSFRDK